MNFKQAAILSNFISKDYAEDIFRLIVAYRDISASEAASRLGMHIRTVQEFLDAMTDGNILEKKEVFEKKRPYFRYALKKKKIEIIIDLEKELMDDHKDHSTFKIRELRNANVKFSIARNGEYFSTISVWSGDGRASKERKINLTIAQGKFLYYLPFPDAEPLSIEQIMKKAEIDPMQTSEIADIVEELDTMKVLEKI